MWETIISNQRKKGRESMGFLRAASFRAATFFLIFREKRLQTKILKIKVKPSP